MKVFKFIKWWFNRLDFSDLFIPCILLSAVIYFTCLHFFGIYAVFIFLIGILIITLLCILFNAIKNQWIKYNKHKDEESEMIIAKLRGHSPNTMH
jgi:hypothetical protein